MVVVPAGTFLIGSPESEEDRSDNEGPQHEVNIAAPFAMSKFDVTFDEWDQCTAAGLPEGTGPQLESRQAPGDQRLLG